MMLHSPIHTINGGQGIVSDVSWEPFVPNNLQEKIAMQWYQFIMKQEGNQFKTSQHDALGMI